MVNAKMAATQGAKKWLQKTAGDLRSVILKRIQAPPNELLAEDDPDPPDAPPMNLLQARRKRWSTKKGE
jgi:hypothetical protein